MHEVARGNDKPFFFRYHPKSVLLPAVRRLSTYSHVSNGSHVACYAFLHSRVIIRRIPVSLVYHHLRAVADELDPAC